MAFRNPLGKQSISSKKEKFKKKNQEKSSPNWLKLNLKLGWIEEYQDLLNIWQEMISITRSLEKQVKQEGLHQQSWSQFEKKNQEELGKTKGEQRIRNFREKIGQWLKEQINIITENEAINISSDVIESLFGKYKYFSRKGPLKEIRRTILTIPLSTIEISREVIKKALETIKNIDIKNWEEEMFGQSILSKRKIALNS